jgi:hypothetical protein
MPRNRLRDYPPDPNAVFEICFCCGERFQMGPHAYHGQYIFYYKISLCNACYSGSWDGISPFCEEKLVDYLSKNNIPMPARNSKGLLPRDP